RGRDVRLGRVDDPRRRPGQALVGRVGVVNVELTAAGICPGQVDSAGAVDGSNREQRDRGRDLRGLVDLRGRVIGSDAHNVDAVADGLRHVGGAVTGAGRCVVGNGRPTGLRV